MKKINWRIMAMVLLIVAMAWFGVWMMEDEWTEDMSGVIWIIGMLSVTEIYVVSEIKSIIKYFAEKRKSNHSSEES